ncbi:conserved Plasmodium protein, unknown function [Plasmodium vinckei vinckei]|uniref:Uncharacterized protein n=1 Tax=Plasmodium vinckei vinckei TaxID=54757 RepID=A0A449BST8_PLAVN|nr:conserved Plasmodium protein, unknown function [Plasmodium vinckei vinckei]VEV56511.1 conserved Plasmodium protein, unknown function [Plasmodium vinckei vinckei]
MNTNYSEIRKLFNYYIREYYYQKSKGTYFVHIKNPGILFTSLKFYKKKKTIFPNIYDWYFGNLNNLKKNKDVLHYENYYNIKNIYSYKINKNIEKKGHGVETGNIYIDDSESNLDNTYRTSNLYYNMNPVYLSKICLYDLNDYHVLFSTNYYDAFIQFYYSLISYKMDLNNMKMFPNLRILISHIKNLNNIINDELIKSSFFYLIKQKKIFNEDYLHNIFKNIYSIMLHNSPLYLFVDDFSQFRIILNFINKGEIRDMFESALPYPYYIIVDENINIYNIQNFNAYLKEYIFKERDLNTNTVNSEDYDTNKESRDDIFSPNNNNQHKNVEHIENFKIGNENSKDVSNPKNSKIYFFKFIKIFDMKPNYRFTVKK